MAVAERGNMAKAADSLAISRPVVSKTIGDLEHTLGVRLFDRSAQGVELTLYGRALLRRSVAVFDELRQSVKEMEFLSDASAGELRVGCPEVMAGGFISAVIDQVAAQHPKVIFSTELGTIHDLQFHSLRERKCELVIGRLWDATVDAPEFDAEALFHERLFVVAGPDSQWARRRKISLTQLLDAPWIVAPVEMEPGAPMAEAFRAIGVEGPRTNMVQSPARRSAALAPADSHRDVEEPHAQSHRPAFYRARPRVGEAIGMTSEDRRSALGHSCRYCHVRSLVRYLQHRALPRPTETRLLAAFLRPFCKQPAQPPQLRRPGFARSATPCSENRVGLEAQNRRHLAAIACSEVARHGR
jgi:DNA-binding transcriptional LysR family regulator